MVIFYSKLLVYQQKDGLKISRIDPGPNYPVVFMDGASKLHPYSVIFSIIGSQGATNSFQSTLVSFLNFLAMFFPKYLTVLQCCIQFVCARIHDFVASFLKQNVVLGTP